MYEYVWMKCSKLYNAYEPEYNWIEIRKMAIGNWNSYAIEASTHEYRSDSRRCCWNRLGQKMDTKSGDEYRTIVVVWWCIRQVRSGMLVARMEPHDYLDLQKKNKIAEFISRL